MAYSYGCRCKDCGRPYRVDVLVPDELWKRIKPEPSVEGGLLCGSCIMQRIESISGFDAWQLVDPHAQPQRLINAAIQLHEYLHANAGTNDDWPIEIKAASDSANLLTHNLQSLHEAIQEYQGNDQKPAT